LQYSLTFKFLRRGAHLVVNYELVIANGSEEPVWQTIGLPSGSCGETSWSVLNAWEHAPAIENILPSHENMRQPKLTAVAHLFLD
jgi:hypothetical protein